MLFLTTGAPLFQSRDFLSKMRHRSGPTSGIEPSSVEVYFFFDEKDKKKIRIDKEDLTINLMTTANTTSDQSTVDDVASTNDEDTKGRNELAAMQAELARMNEENQRLRAMLNQVTSTYF